MRTQFTAPITYYLQEGKANLRQTIQIALRAAKLHNIKQLVIFTAQGDGIRTALDEIGANSDEYGAIKVVAVTFPQGMQFKDAENKPLTAEISAENKLLLQAHNVPLVRAHMPFAPIPPYFRNRGVLANDLSLVENALNIFGGSMSLCIQAILMACDAGVIEIDAHVVACTSDTAILARATCTTRLLTDFIVREVLCKPAIFDIGKKEEREAAQFPGEAEPPQIEGELKSLPESSADLETNE